MHVGGWPTLAESRRRLLHISPPPGLTGETTPDDVGSCYKLARRVLFPSACFMALARFLSGPEPRRAECTM